MVIHSRASDGRSASQCPLGVQAVWKRARAEDAQNGFLCRRLSVEVASNICSRTGRIEIVLLYENSTAEFSHSLDPKRKVRHRHPVSQTSPAVTLPGLGQ